MRELDQEEMGAISGGYSPRGSLGWSNQFQTARPPNPLTVTFGTPVEPGFEVPGILPNWHF